MPAVATSACGEDAAPGTRSSLCPEAVAQTVTTCVRCRRSDSTDLRDEPGGLAARTCYQQARSATEELGNSKWQVVV